MKTIKRILYIIAGLLIAGCIGILVCAMNPSITELLAEKVQQLQAGTNGSGEGQTEGITSGGASGDYVSPENMPETVPEGVSGLSGYRPVTGDTEQITQEEADNLGNILAPGETGEGITFSAEYYPYYAMLDDTLKQLYCQVYANALELNISFTPIVVVTAEQAQNVVEAVYNDHPELFWMDAEFSCKYLKTGICVEITLQYNETLNDLETAANDFMACAEEILSGAESLGSNYEKERYVHDALVQIVEYDAGAAANQSAYSALVMGKSVCAGYARAFQYLMQQLGIPCYYCTGYSGGDHAWNIVKMNSLYRNVDVTWDDTDPATYNYYNKSDREIASTHARTGLAVYLPACEDITQVETEGTGDSIVDAHINPYPQEPLRWHSRGKTDSSTDNNVSEEERRKENLDKAGITEDDVLDTLEEYYTDCEEQLKDAGTGDKQFTNVIPETLWNAVERAYSSGSFRTGYVDSALEEMEAEYFAIQLQVQRLGGGYYRLYHYIYTY